MESRTKTAVLAVVVIVATLGSALYIYSVYFTPSFVTSLTLSSDIIVSSSAPNSNFTLLYGTNHTVFCCLSFQVEKNNSDVTIAYNNNNYSNSFGEGPWPAVVVYGSNSQLVCNFQGAYKIMQQTFELNAGRYNLGLAVNHATTQAKYSGWFSMMVTVKYPMYAPLP